MPTKVTLGDGEGRTPPRDSGLVDVDTGETGEGAETGDTVETGDTSDDSDTARGETGDTALAILALDLVAPSNGSTEGGETAVIYGGPFDESARVTFGEAGLATVRSWTDTTVTVVTPAYAAEGAVDVIVTTDGGTGTLAAGFTFERPCTGITASPATVHVYSLADEDTTLMLTGCATGVRGEDQLYADSDRQPYGVSWLGVPASVDGTTTVTLHWDGTPRVSSASLSAVLHTDQGTVSIAVTADSGG